MPENKRNGNTFVFAVGIIVSVLMIAGCFFLIFVSFSKGTVWVKTSGNPREVTDAFFSSIIEGSYEEAYRYLDNYNDLGLGCLREEYPEYYDTLTSGYEYNISEECFIDGLNATQRVVFYSYDFNNLDECISENIETILAKKVETLPADELYEDDGEYKSELIDEVYDEALEKALKEDCGKIEYDIDIALKYTGDDWKIIVDDVFLNALSGGTR